MYDVPLIKHKTILNVSKSRNKVNLLYFNKEERNSYGKVILGTDGLISQVIEQKELKKTKITTYAILEFLVSRQALKLFVTKLNNNKKKEFI